MTVATTTEKLVWVCELSKDKPVMKWVPTNVLEYEDEDDTDFVCNSLIIKAAVLGVNAVESERNVIAFKTKGFQDKKEYEQPLFSLTLGRNDTISGLDFTVATDNEVEFKLVQGTGPVYITCTHLVEVPAQDEHPTMMTNSEIEDEELEEMAEDMNGEEEVKGKRTAAMKNGNGNGHCLKNGKMLNGNGTNGVKNLEAQQA
jgi:hypothetical protein